MAELEYLDPTWEPKSRIALGGRLLVDNFTQEIVIGASPSYYVSWNIAIQVAGWLVIVFVLATNSVVIALYHHGRRKATMHDLYVCHLAVVDLLGGFLATVPVLVGYIQLIADVGHVFLIPCFVSALSTLSLNLMATIIVNILSYDRLQLLKLGIRFHMMNNRFGVARLTTLWVTMVAFTLLIVLLISLTPLGRRYSDCAYGFSTESYVVKIIMTVIAVVPLSVLVVINCLVLRGLRQLEERHPHAINRSRSSSMARHMTARPGGALEDGHESENSQTMWTPSIEPTSTGLGASTAPSEDTVGQLRPPHGSASQVTKTLWRSFKSDRSLSRRASTSICCSMFTFILCMSPMSALLIIEAWVPDIIVATTHRWHLFFTVCRTLFDPFLFAHNIPSFRMQYGTTIIKWEQKWRWFRWMRHFCYGMLFFLDHGIVADAQERLDRKRRGSPVLIRVKDGPGEGGTKTMDMSEAMLNSAPQLNAE